jgi:hypothetical protein
MKKQLTHPKPVFGLQLLESFIFTKRRFVLCAFVLVTIFLAWKATSLKPDASLERMIPQAHPYIQNYLEHKSDLENLANFIRIAVVAKEGDIFDAAYMEALSKISDEVFYLPGVDRSGLKSLWTPNVRWVEVTEQGFAGGPVIPPNYNGSEAAIEELRHNILRSGQVGRLIANDFQSSIIYVPLLEIHPETGDRLDYHAFSMQLEDKVRARFSGDESAVEIRIVGFAKKIGDMIDGLGAVILFFAIAFVITCGLLWLYTRSVLSTVIAMFCSSISVVWLMGLMTSLGYGLDPYSMLVPFIVFATAVSHGVQYINGFMLNSARGLLSAEASRATFRQHYLPALLALISDAIGFLSLILIEVNVIRDLAVAASIGIASIIFTNMILLPLLLSYARIDRQKLVNADNVDKTEVSGWMTLSKVMSEKGMRIVFALTSGAALVALVFASQLKVGELDAGAPELQPDSRYNLDNAYISEHYATSADVMVVMVESPAEQCNAYQTMQLMERLQWRLQHLPGVQSSVSIADLSRAVTKAFNEGSYKWHSVSRNQTIIDTSLQHAPAGLINRDCSLTPILVYLNDHRAETLQAVVTEIEAFSSVFESDDAQFLLAAGNAGIEAATNQVIDASQVMMLVVVFSVVALMVLLAYRSLIALVCIICPLLMTSLLCMALMSVLGIGVKVSTLPIIALGVGLGVDYSIYIFSKLRFYMSDGYALKQAYYETLKTTGKAVAFTGLTLSVGTATWIFSPIKFQSDMGLLLTCMFLWNMVGAMTLLPALSYLFMHKQTEPSGEKPSTVRAPQKDYIDSFFKETRST